MILFLRAYLSFYILSSLWKLITDISMCGTLTFPLLIEADCFAADTCLSDDAFSQLSQQTPYVQYIINSPMALTISFSNMTLIMFEAELPTFSKS